MMYGLQNREQRAQAQQEEQASAKEYKMQLCEKGAQRDLASSTGYPARTSALRPQLQIS
jgi:hypothetical protein